MRALKKSIHIVLLLLMVLFLPLTAFAVEADDDSYDETDLQISVETITHRQYSGMAVTDGYGIEILTKEGYAQAGNISAIQEERTRAMQESLLFTQEDRNNNDIATIVEQLGMFDSNYSIASLKKDSISNTGSIFLTIIVLLIAIVAGSLIAVGWTKRKGYQVL